MATFFSSESWAEFWTEVAETVAEIWWTYVKFEKQEEQYENF